MESPRRQPSGAASEPQKRLGALADRGFRAAVREMVEALARRTLLAGSARDLGRVLKANAGGRMPAARLNGTGMSRQLAAEHAPVSGYLFRLAMANLPEDLSEFTFVDLGSGRGRIVCLALLFNFRNVLGVEFAERLHREATLNIHATLATGRVRCDSITSVVANGTSLPVPNTPCVFYIDEMPNGRKLHKLLNDIRVSYIRNPRTVMVICYNPIYQSLLDETDFLRLVRLRPLCRLVHLLASPHDLRIYETRPL